MREYKLQQSLKATRRHAILTADLPEEDAGAIFGGRMDPRHDHLNELLDRSDEPGMALPEPERETTSR